MILSRKACVGAAAVIIGLQSFVSPALAGFEFSGGPAPVQTQTPAPMAAPADAPMPIVPAAPVQSESLPPLQETQILALPPQTTSGAAGEDVYIKRQRVIETAPSPIPVKAQSTPGGLVINPYPLQAMNGQAVHSDTNRLPVEQAMMEETGRLKTVATPGDNTAAGMIARADISSRYHSPQIPMVPQPADTMAYDVSMLTPIPGGEGPDLNSAQPPQAVYAPTSPAAVQAQPLMPSPAIPAAYPAPVPRAPSQGNNGFADAVGFGRELPLALALSQVVPPDYSFSFGPSVDAGETVSWQGGKSWDAVLQDMLQPIGMRAVISGKQVMIQKSS